MQARKTPKLGTRLFFAKFLQKCEALMDSTRASVRVIRTSLASRIAFIFATERSLSRLYSASVSGGSYLTAGRIHKTEFTKAMVGPASNAMIVALRSNCLIIFAPSSVSQSSRGTRAVAYGDVTVVRKNNQPRGLEVQATCIGARRDYWASSRLVPHLR